MILEEQEFYDFDEVILKSIDGSLKSLLGEEISEIKNESFPK